MKFLANFDISFKKCKKLSCKILDIYTLNFINLHLHQLARLSSITGSWFPEGLVLLPLFIHSVKTEILTFACSHVERIFVLLFSLHFFFFLSFFISPGNASGKNLLRNDSRCFQERETFLHSNIPRAVYFIFLLLRFDFCNFFYYCNCFANDDIELLGVEAVPG